MSQQGQTGYKLDKLSLFYFFYIYLGFFFFLLFDILPFE